MKKLLFAFFYFLSIYIAIGQTIVNPTTTGITGGPDGGDLGIVGNISGSYSVSPSGAMVYSVPLMIPEGPGGLKPNLSKYTIARREMV